MGKEVRVFNLELAVTGLSLFIYQTRLVCYQKELLIIVLQINLGLFYDWYGLVKSGNNTSIGVPNL